MANGVHLSRFALAVPEYYNQFKDTSKYYEGYCNLMNLFPEKAKQYGYLDMGDLCDIAIWGGNDYGVMQNLCGKNSPDQVKAATRTAYRHIGNGDAGQALRAVLDLYGWGLTYGSKTLMFMNPDEYVALDSHIRNALNNFEEIRKFRYENENSAVRGYLKFLEICRYLQSQVKADPPFPGPGGRWRLADIQQAIFQFSKEHGTFRDC